MSVSVNTDGGRDALADIDVVSNEVYLRDVPFDAFARLRREAPLHLQRVPDPEMVDAVWVASTAELVREISGRPEVFSSQANGVRLDATRVEEGRKVEGGNFIMLDDPEHREKRKRVQPGFSPRALRAFEDAFRSLAEEIVARAVAAPEFDAVEALSVHVPITAICQLLGIPLTMHPASARGVTPSSRSPTRPRVARARVPARPCGSSAPTCFVSPPNAPPTRATTSSRRWSQRPTTCA